MSQWERQVEKRHGASEVSGEKVTDAIARSSQLISRVIKYPTPSHEPSLSPSDWANADAPGAWGCSLSLSTLARAGRMDGQRQEDGAGRGFTSVRRFYEGRSGRPSVSLSSERRPARKSAEERRRSFTPPLRLPPHCLFPPSAPPLITSLYITFIWLALWSRATCAIRELSSI